MEGKSLPLHPEEVRSDSGLCADENGSGTPLLGTPPHAQTPVPPAMEQNGDRIGMVRLEKLFPFCYRCNGTEWRQNRHGTFRKLFPFCYRCNGTEWRQNRHGTFRKIVPVLLPLQWNRMETE